MPGLVANGLGSGLDINSLVDQLVAAERQPAANRLNLREARTNAELSAVGKLKSALSAFKDALAAFETRTAFEGRKVTNSNDELLSVAAGGTSVPGSYTVEVLATATNQKLASAPFIDPTAPIDTGTLTISVGGASMAVAISPDATSLNAIRDAINGAAGNPGVRATIVNADDGSRLLVTADATGTANAISITVSGGNGGLAQFAYDPQAPFNPMTQLQAPTDATLRIDGFVVTSPTNSITSAIDGVTLELLAAEVGTGIDVSIALDKDKARTSVAGFVTAYNKLIDTINEVTKYNPDTREAAPLLGDAVVRGLKDGIRREITGVVGDAVLPSLASIGITTESNGKLALNTTTLDKVFAASFDDVGILLAGEGGLGVRLQTFLDGALKTTGSLTIREDDLKLSLKDITSQRETLDLRIERVRERLQKQFNAMDQLLSQLRSTSDFLTRQLPASS